MTCNYLILNIIQTYHTINVHHIGYCISLYIKQSIPIFHRAKCLKPFRCHPAPNVVEPPPGPGTCWEYCASSRWTHHPGRRKTRLPHRLTTMAPSCKPSLKGTCSPVIFSTQKKKNGDSYWKPPFRGGYGVNQLGHPKLKRLISSFRNFNWLVSPPHPPCYDFLLVISLGKMVISQPIRNMNVHLHQSLREICVPHQIVSFVT